MDISAGVLVTDHVAMAAIATKRVPDTTPRLRLVRDREQALSQARAARRKLEGRPDQAGDRFSYLRRSHD
jgi:hypothetical protein